MGRDAGGGRGVGNDWRAEERGASRDRERNHVRADREFGTWLRRCRSKNKMISGAAPRNPVSTVSSPAAELWHRLLGQELQRSAKFTEEFYDKLRAEKLTFGNRVHCTFLRPFFLSPEDEQRVRV